MDLTVNKHRQELPAKQEKKKPKKQKTVEKDESRTGAANSES